MILIAVIASIMVMGPYVLRGVNAYMRSWEISAQEARHDIGQEVPAWAVEETPPPPPDPCYGIVCGNYSFSNCPIADNCCMKRENYLWYVPNDPSQGAAECRWQYEACVEYNVSICDTFSNDVCCTDNCPYDGC